MMDIIEFWQALVDKWNTENYCDKCWTFGAPLSDTAANTQQQEQKDACCVHVILTNLRETQTPRYAPRTGLLVSRDLLVTQTVHFLIKDEVGKNVYNEILEHPISESKYATILKPLRDCITPKAIERFCEILGYPMDVVMWGMDIKIDWLDDVYSGITINVSLRVNNTL